jgi:uncharacterized protein YcbK (DUF882 family)
MLNDWTRRGLLGLAFGATLSGARPPEDVDEDCEHCAAAAGVIDDPAEEVSTVQYEPYCSEEIGERVLSIKNINTRDEFEGVYWRDGGYEPEALQRLNEVLRDHKAEKIADFDPRLFDLLHELGQDLKSTEQLQVISAYRSPRTNALARRRSRRVARNSYHMKGMAVDLRVPGISALKVRNAARALKTGGVGYYRRSSFVHVDVGPVRYWYG